MTQTIKPIEQIVSAIYALDLGPIKFKLMDKDEGHGWSREKAGAVEREYKRFLVLLAKHPDMPLVPSKDVDRFWHGHILDTMKYAEDCHKTFGHFVHHFPYFGMRGAEDFANMQKSAQTMRDLYRAEFSANADQKPTVAYCGAKVEASDAAYCGAKIEASDAAYCGAKVEAGDAAYCGAKVEASDAAYCGAKVEASDAAYCGAKVEASDAAYCGAKVEASDAAYCGAKVEASDAAYCGAKVEASDAAYCGAKVEASDAAYCGAKVEASDAAYCGAKASVSKPSSFEAIMKTSTRPS